MKNRNEAVEKLEVNISRLEDESCQISEGLYPDIRAVKDYACKEMHASIESCKQIKALLQQDDFYEDYSYYVGTKIELKNPIMKYSAWLSSKTPKADSVSRKPENDTENDLCITDDTQEKEKE